MKASLKKAQAVYNKKCKQLIIRINKDTEADIFEWISRGKPTVRIKELIRKDIKENPVN